MFNLDQSKYILVLVCDGMASPLAPQVTVPALVPRSFKWLLEEESKAPKTVSIQEDSLLAKLGKRVLFSDFRHDSRLEKVVTRPTRLSATPDFWSCPIFVLLVTD